MCLGGERGENADEENGRIEESRGVNVSRTEI